MGVNLQGLLSFFRSRAPQDGNLFHDAIELGNGETVPFSTYRGKVVLMVNTASACGFTKQYDALEKVYQKYRPEGFEVIGFPSNDFLGQEPGSDGEIAEFCRVNFGVSFPLAKKAPVSGRSIQPFFHFLTTKGPGKLRGRVLWNFEKFLIGRTGEVVGRWRSLTPPDAPEIVTTIERELKTPIE